MTPHEELLHEYVNNSSTINLESTRAMSHKLYKENPELLKYLIRTSDRSKQHTLKIFHHKNRVQNKNFPINEFYKKLNQNFTPNEIHNLLNYCNLKEIYPSYNEWSDYIEHHKHMPLEWHLVLQTPIV